MAYRYNENSRKNLAPPFTTETAREAQKLSAKNQGKAKHENCIIRKEIEKRLRAEDMEEIARGLIDRAKESDKAFELLRDTLGQKPKEEVVLQSQTIEVSIDD